MNIRGCCRTGPENGDPACQHRRASERAYILAHWRGELMRLAREILRSMSIERLPIDRDTIALRLAKALKEARPHPLPWRELAGGEPAVERMIELVAAEVEAQYAERRCA
jgi:hypothetical protein